MKTDSIVSQNVKTQVNLRISISFIVSTISINSYMEIFLMNKRVLKDQCSYGVGIHFLLAMKRIKIRLINKQIKIPNFCFQSLSYNCGCRFLMNCLSSHRITQSKEEVNSYGLTSYNIT